MKVVKQDDEVFDYALKYEQDREVFPDIEKNLKEKLYKASEDIYKAFGVSHCARIDFIVRDGIPYFLEINTIP